MASRRVVHRRVVNRRVVTNGVVGRRAVRGGAGNRGIGNGSVGSRHGFRLPLWLAAAQSGWGTAWRGLRASSRWALTPPPCQGRLPQGPLDRRISGVRGWFPVAGGGVCRSVRGGCRRGYAPLRLQPLDYQEGECHHQQTGQRQTRPGFSAEPAFRLPGHVRRPGSHAARGGPSDRLVASTYRQDLAGSQQRDHGRGNRAADRTGVGLQAARATRPCAVFADCAFAPSRAIATPNQGEYRIDGT
jgi:hypothetical protein